MLPYHNGAPRDSWFAVAAVATAQSRGTTPNSKGRSLYTRLSTLLLPLLLVAAACGSGDDTTPVATPAATPAGTSDVADGPTTTFGTVDPDDEDPLERRRVQLSEKPTIVFDGTECLYTGPESVELGATRITVDNQSDTRVVVEVSVLPEDKTWDDVVAYVDSGEAARTGDLPEWIPQSRKVTAPAGRDITVTRQLVGGNYAVTCFINSDPPTVMASAPLAVLGEGKFCIGLCAGEDVTTPTSP